MNVDARQTQHSDLALCKRPGIDRLTELQRAVNDQVHDCVWCKHVDLQVCRKYRCACWRAVCSRVRVDRD